MLPLKVKPPKPESTQAIIVNSNPNFPYYCECPISIEQIITYKSSPLTTDDTFLFTVTLLEKDLKLPKVIYFFDFFRDHDLIFIIDDGEYSAIQASSSADFNGKYVTFLCQRSQISYSMYDDTMIEIIKQRYQPIQALHKQISPGDIS